MRSDITPMTLRENKVTTLLAHCIHCSRLKLNSVLIGAAQFKQLANIAKMNETCNIAVKTPIGVNPISKGVSISLPPKGGVSETPPWKSRKELF